MNVFDKIQTTTMGYNHYWYRAEEIDRSLFERVVLDFERLIIALEDAGVRLAGFSGRGLPGIDHSGIIFNGVEDCGHPRNPDIYIPFPCDIAGGIGSSASAIYSSNPLFVELKHRTCNGMCRCESFNLPRRVDGRWHKPDKHGRCFFSCKTAFKPYDLAVQCALLICKHHLGERILVSSGGSDFHWNDPRRFCFVHLGYPLNEFTLVNELGLISTEHAKASAVAWAKSTRPGNGERSYGL